ncbi:tautomerase family protein [Mycobacterium spongiae]|uniref:Cis-3-chloroacrylic acid dehalogenase n=1 Tax=Mycobacterium spongiae TaxID=886343 RepID=A0A975JYB2_9MYCO|nr:tautomerase family protein [Mycobacterium spongiae]QUR66848.1 cis-3-chloroacrylic acid dehalogenase [Mycobacterium spongiae]
MPLYQCVVPTGSLSADTRTELAEAITEIHSSITGAPRGFVNVLFVEYEPGAYFTAGKPNSCAVINGNIRAGRDRETRARLLTELSRSWVSITGQDARSLLIGLNEVDPTSIMEAGLIMPAPGEETEWLEKNQHVLGELLASQ